MKHYLGIDFGTTNTYVARCSNRNADALIAEPMPINGRTSNATCLLWREPAKDETHVVTYGSKAEEEWANYSEEQQNEFRLVHGFKPNIAGEGSANRDAYANARVFLGKICQFVLAINKDFIEQGTAVVGVPSEIGKNHKDATKRAAQEAGFMSVECVDEPLGALACHLSDGTLTIEDARRGVAVIDFGGGTFDVALVDAEIGLQKPWGDQTLGGLLFDDLFYQWINEQYQGSLYDGLTENKKKVIWMAECRRLKESFSQSWENRGTLESFIGSIIVRDKREWLRSASVADFSLRAKHYVPSALAREHFRQNGQTGKVVSTDPINLFDWISEILAEGLKNLEVRSRPRMVILTGGSASWPFMRELVAEAFEVDPAKNILKSSDPACTIGSGLALYLGLKARLDDRKSGLKGRLPSAREQLSKAINERLDVFAYETAKLVLSRIMPAIEERIWSWYKNGGSLGKLEARIEGICKQKKDEIKAVIRGECKNLTVDIAKLVKDHLVTLLRENHIYKDITSYLPDIDSVTSPTAPGGTIIDQIVKAFGELAETVTNVVGGVIGVVIVTVKIHVLIGLAMVHPIVAFLAGVTALAALMGLGEATKEWAEQKVKAFNFEGWSLVALKLALTDGSLREKLRSGRANAQAQLREAIRQGLKGANDEKGNVIDLEKATVDTFDKVVSLVISDLGVLEQFGSAG